MAMWLDLPTIPTLILLILSADRLRLLWRNLYERPEKTARLVALFGGWICWILTGVPVGRSLVHELQGPKQDSRGLLPEEEFYRIAAAYERLTDPDTNIEWLKQKEWATSFQFTALYWMGLLICCTAWFALFRRIVIRYGAQISLMVREKLVSSLIVNVQHTKSRFSTMLRIIYRQWLHIESNVDWIMIFLLLVSMRSTYWWYQLVLEHQDIVGNDPFEILEIPTTSTFVEIKRSYRKISLRYHLD